jgi:shikimate 5-dehydrogenase
MNTLPSLIRRGTLTIAEQPPANPTNLEFNQYVIPLIGKDYPAKTAAMWNAAYEAMGLPIRNIMLVGSAKDLAEIYKTLADDSKYLGGGVGVGLKDESLPYLDELDSTAEEAGSVNFIRRVNGGSLRGYNTDGIGYAQGLADLLQKRGTTLAGKKVVMLGAGGTASSIGIALADQQVELVILNRTVETAKQLAQRINTHVEKKYHPIARFFRKIGRLIHFPMHTTVRFGGEDSIPHEIRNADVVANVSSKGEVGQLADYSALAPAILPPTPQNIAQNRAVSKAMLSGMMPHVIISDIVIRKGELTPTLQDAAAMGYITQDGLPMVINQGVKAFWILHGEELAKKNVSETEIQTIMTKAATNS